MELEIEREERGNILIIKPRGRIDHLTVEDFDNSIKKAIGEGKFRIIIDCSELLYISSAGLGVLIGYIEEVRENRGDIIICCTSPKVHEIFDLLGFTKIYRFFSKLKEAVAFFSNG